MKGSGPGVLGLLRSTTPAPRAEEERQTALGGYPSLPHAGRRVGGTLFFLNQSHDATPTRDYVLCTAEGHVLGGPSPRSSLLDRRPSQGSRREASCSPAQSGPERVQLGRAHDFLRL